MSFPQATSRGRSNRRERTLSLVLAGALISAIAVLSFLPTGDKMALHTTGRFHSLGHVLVFVVMTFLGLKGVRSTRGRVLLFLGLLLFGFGLEFGEHVVFKGEIEWKDVLSDSAGVLAGALIAGLG